MAELEKWPTSGPDFNQWNQDIARFMVLVQGQPNLWLRNSQLKYLSVTVDTRSGNFVLKDRDDNKVSVEMVMDAINDASERYGKKTA